MRVIVTGGGTGGHIYPALSIVEKIKEKEPNSEFLYIGTHNRMENDIVPKYGLPYKSITITGIYRKKLYKNVITVKNFISAYYKSRKIVKEFNPDVVVGTGGYVTGPVIYAASKLGYKSFILENDAFAGMANRFLSKYVSKIGICFEKAREQFPNEKVEFTGNPRAEMVANSSSEIDILGFDKTKQQVLIVTGSLGAMHVNNAVSEASKYIKDKKYQVIFVTGKKYYDDIEKSVTKSDNLILLPYIDNMPAVLKNIDLIVMRAGATMVSEILALGLPSILIPSPYVGNNEQVKNANVIKENGACEIVLEENVKSELFDKIDDLMNNHIKREAMSKRAYEMGIRDSATRIYNILKTLVKR